MGKIRSALYRFMYGRYGGADKLNYFLLCVYLFLWIFNLFIGNPLISLTLDILSFSIAIIVFFRIFSKNVYKRRRENELFVRFSSRFLPNIDLIKSKWRDRKTHKYLKCPACKAILRLKKIPGEHTAKCPRCNERFKVKN